MNLLIPVRKASKAKTTRRQAGLGWDVGRTLTVTLWSAGKNLRAGFLVIGLVWCLMSNLGWNDLKHFPGILGQCKTERKKDG